MDCNRITSGIKTIFPEGTEIRPEGEGSTGPRFWGIPGKNGAPRWILPHDPGRALPFLRQWRPYDLLSRFKWQGLMAAYRAKNLGCVPGVVPLRIDIPEGAGWRHVGWPGFAPPVPVIYVGTPGPYRKWVFGLIDTQNNRVRAVGKAPLEPQAGRAILGETALLDQLAHEKPGLAPRNLFAHRARGIAVQEYLSATPTGRNLTEKHIRFLLDLAIPEETLSLDQVIEDLFKRNDGLEDENPETRSILERVLEEGKDRASLPAVWEHGDFAPWNLKRMENGSLCAIDWENAVRGGLPGFDLVHFCSMQAYLFGEKKLFPKSFWVFFRGYLERLEIAPSMAGKLIGLGLLRDWVRCRETGNPSRADFLLRALAASLREGS